MVTCFTTPTINLMMRTSSLNPDFDISILAYYQYHYHDFLWEKLFSFAHLTTFCFPWLSFFKLLNLGGFDFKSWLFIHLC
jgi:hypothetical protein